MTKYSCVLNYIPTSGNFNRGLIDWMLEDQLLELTVIRHITVIIYSSSVVPGSTH